MSENDKRKQENINLDFGDDDFQFEWGEDEVCEKPGEEMSEDDFLDTMPPSKKSMTIFFLIDPSGSMEGTKIHTVNATMEELLPELVGIGGAETDIRYAVLTFGERIEWLKKPLKVDENCIWERIKKVGGLTPMGGAFKELCAKLSRSEFMNNPSLSYAPVIFLMSDGAPTDDHVEGFERLQKNNWFKYGLKIAVGIGAKPNMDILRGFTGNEELAVQVHNAKELKEMVTLLAIRSSQIGSKSMDLTGDGKEKSAQDVYKDKEKRLAEEIKKAKDIMSDENVADITYDEGW